MSLAIEFARAKEKLKNTHGAWLTLLEDPSTPEDVKAFALRVFELRQDRENGAHWTWEMFNEVLDMSTTGFLDSFLGFVSHDLLDDGAFRIEWRVYKGLDTFEVATKDDPWAEPVVLRDSDCGTQNVALLMEALDAKRKTTQLRIETEGRIKELLRKARQGG